LQRDPAKRLGALKDAQEIKQHMFFKGVDWNSVFRKELKPPVPLIPPVPKSIIPAEKLYGDIGLNESTRIKGWTFVSEDDNL
jgi:hypothetical protein